MRCGSTCPPVSPAPGGLPNNMQEPWPLITLLVRSMDRATLAAALDSVARQTDPRLEVLVVNATGTAHRALGLQCGPFPLRLVQRDGVALSRPAAANLGLDHAAGQWLLFLDDDDLLDADHIARLRAALAAAPQHRVAYAGVRLLAGDGSPCGMLDEPFDATRLWLANYLPIHAVLFERSFIDAGLRFDEALDVYEDWDFWLQLAGQGEFLHVPGASASYRLIGDSGLSAQRDAAATAAGRAAIYRKWLPRLDSAGLDRLATAAELARGRLVDAMAANAVLTGQVAQRDAALDETRRRHEQLAARQLALTIAATARADSEEQRADAEVQRADAEVQRSAAAMQSAQQYQHELLRQIADHNTAYARLEQGYRQILGSLSWRITRPLRSVRSQLARIDAAALLRRGLRALPLSNPTRQRAKLMLAASRWGGAVLRRLAPPPANSPGPAAMPMTAVLDKEAVRAEAEAELSAFLAGDRSLHFAPAPPVPKISVVVVLYNQAGLSLLCLQALAQSQGASFETIVVDNGSSDRVPQLLGRIHGVRILRPGSNLGFLRAVNLAAEQASGEYLLLLNNDAVVEPETLARAAARLDAEPDAGAVGGPILLWDGRLQEAGSIVWRDGSCQGYGRGDSPDAPAYRFVRDVDYCSGAFLMLRRALFDQLGRFDEAYAPAYYEESDFCVRLWESGHRVVYDPRVRVKHFEFASDVGQGQAMLLQQRNRDRFVAAHAGYLRGRCSRADGGNIIHRARQILRPDAMRVLMIDDRVPAPSLGRGYPRAARLAHAVAAQGHAVTYYPLLFADETWADVYAVLPERMEVITQQGVAGLAAFVEQRAGMYDMIIVSRPHNMEVVQQLRRNHAEWFGGARIVYDAEALFSAREMAKAAVLGQALSAAGAQALLRDEMALVEGADRIVAVCDAEAQHFRQSGCDDVVVLGHALQWARVTPAFEARAGFLFVGAITEDGCPNGDSMLWFAREVWPAIVRELGAQARLDMVGVCESTAVRSLASASIRIHGRVADLGPHYDAARVFVVPTRFAAGMPHKAHEAAARGLPMVATPLIAHQLGWQHELLVGDDAAGFAQACVRLHRDGALWTSLRSRLHDAVIRDCSADAFDRAVREILR